MSTAAARAHGTKPQWLRKISDTLCTYYCIEMRIWSAFVSKNKNTCSCLPRKESVYKKMSLSLDCFCLQRATVCYSGLIWSCCGFLEFSPHIPYSGSFNLFLWWCKEYVKQSCKNMLIMLITLSIFTPNTNNPNTKHSGNRAWLISKFYVPKRKCKWYHELVGSH